MFLLSKAFLFAANPGFWLLALLVAGTGLLWTRRTRAGRWLLTVAVGFIVLVSVLPVGHVLIAMLENRFPTVHRLPPRIDGIVVLGGTVNQFLSRARGQPSLTDGAERLTEFVAMARRHPEARLVFSGGSGAAFAQDVKESEVARAFFDQMGLDTARIVFESDSRNTWENAVYTRRLMNPKPGEVWVLITSALHMPRAVGVFRKAGWQPLPFPVDYLTAIPPGFPIRFDMAGGIERLWTAMREWMALAVYRVLGRTETFLPAPAQ